MARPSTGKYNNLIKDIREYTDNNEYPILKELCYLKDYNYDTVMKMQRDNEELMQSIKRLLCKKEAYLEKEGVKGNINSTMAVFSLKQLGWRDKQDDTEEERDIKNAQDIIVKIRKAANNE